jgi:hypothetical protein
MKMIFFLFFSFGIFALDAQETHPAKSTRKLNFRDNEKVRDTIIPAGRNELYLNFGPAFAYLLGAYPSNEANFSLFYKRVMTNPRFALRTGFSFKPETNSNFFSSTYRDVYYDQTDSTRTVNKFFHSNRNKFQLNAGIEFRSKGNKRWSTFAGMDIIGGYFKQHYSLMDVHETLDSTGEWHYNSGSWLLLDYKESDNFYIGISPKLGLRYAFNSHWMMSVQAAFELAYYDAEYYNRNAFGTQIVEHPGSYIDFNMNGLLEDFSVVYRF